MGGLPLNLRSTQAKNEVKADITINGDNKAQYTILLIIPNPPLLPDSTQAVYHLSLRHMVRRAYG